MLQEQLTNDKGQLTFVYKLHLIRKYLLKRRIAWVALLAVMLCTAMVLVVISVMGGWLTMFRNSFHGMTGDIVVQGHSMTGFPYYQEMIDKMPPGVQAAVPAIESVGLINIGGQIREPVQVHGIEIEKIGQVNDFAKSLHFQYELRKDQLLKQAEQPGVTAEQRQQLLDEAEHPTPTFDLLKDRNYQSLAGGAKDKGVRPGMIVSAILGRIFKDKNGKVVRQDVLYDLPVTLTMVRINPDEDIDTNDIAKPAFWIVDDSRTKIYQLDSNSVYVPFDFLQKQLHMDANGDEPARCSVIQIKAKPGQDLLTLRDQIQAVVDKVVNEQGISYQFPITVETWEQSQHEFLSAVEKEVVLTTGLFGIISMVAVLLIFCIFYMIVLEKTKDIGIIKSVGATPAGILQLFLGYGMAIGVVGAGMGFLFAYLIVTNINELHAWLGRQMGIVIWDPQTYQFDTIPNKINPHTAIWIVGVAVLSAVLGALVPAIRAASMNPVEALRYE